MDKYNLRNPAVKRIVQELKELQRDENPDILAVANEDNIFEWHFAIRGAWGTEFEGGIYHGRIIMPAEYPFKPPAFVMLTPSGRFETNVKICLSISSHHPESWQPSWSVRSALVALIAFMQSPGHGALGSLDQPKDVRQQLAAASREKAPAYGNEARQKVIQGIHQRMLDMEALSHQLFKPEPAAAAPAVAAAAPATQEGGEAAAAAAVAAAAQGGQHPAAEAGSPGADQPAAPGEQPAAAGTGAAAPRAEGEAAQGGEAEGLRQRRASLPAAAEPPSAAPCSPSGMQWAGAVGAHPRPPQVVVVGPTLEDRVLTWLAILLVAGILALVLRRLLGGGVGLGEAGHMGQLDSQL